MTPKVKSIGISNHIKVFDELKILPLFLDSYVQPVVFMRFIRLLTHDAITENAAVVLHFSAVF